MKLKLIDNWQHAHHFGSVQLSGVMALVFGAGPALFSAWGAVPDDLKASLPQGWARWIATGGFVLVVAARVLQFDRGKGDGNAQ
ncbi:hypothetical protein WK39_28040 [Burkholderia cepacia]|uniref:DUF7940 domain-containing protein n=2 Tax=Burkholderia cepacia complex TaxID=87882 RepID=UPI00075530F6|nr:hypothetical protein [Burkholderia cepacia]KVS50714.1 hypothetical protein WK39_28040 [Burkholderia cepacia]KVS65740.1 hypothetical protein WK40_12350 [Burkholderia cepacia]